MRNTIRFFALAAGLALAGCSTYQRRWEAARDAVHPGRDSFSGAYVGTWESSRRPGTGGKLWCILERECVGDYHASFKATWHGVFRSEHGAMLKILAPARGGKASFSGNATLRTPIGSGTYTCKGELRPEGISAVYDATYDQGKFILKRAVGTRKTE